MKSKNVARLFIFVFFLCFVFLCQGLSKDWKIPKKIKEIKYKPSEEKKDWLDLETDLNHSCKKFEIDIETRYFTSEKKKKKVIAQMLVNYDAVLVKEDGKTLTSFDDFVDFFKDYDPENYTIDVDISGGAWIDFDGTARGVEFDIIALIEFTIVFTSIAPISSDYGSPPPVSIAGEMTSFHRRICTWF